MKPQLGSRPVRRRLGFRVQDLRARTCRIMVTLFRYCYVCVIFSDADAGAVRFAACRGGRGAREWVLREGVQRCKRFLPLDGFPGCGQTKGSDAENRAPA